MAKGKGELYGPLFTPPTRSLGGHEVHGPREAKSFPDPLGFIKHGSGGHSDSGKGSKKTAKKK